MLKDSNNYVTLLLMLSVSMTQSCTVINSQAGPWWENVERVYSVPWSTGSIYNVTIAVNSDATAFEVYVDGSLHAVRNSAVCTTITKVYSDIHLAREFSLRMVFP